MTKTSKEALVWRPDKALFPFWRRVFHFSSNNKSYHCICDQLALRTNGVWDQWPPEKVNFVKSVSGLIMEEFNWPNSLFIPSDPCEILFWEYSPSVYSDAALVAIADLLFGEAKPSDELLQLCSRLYDLKYGDFIKELEAIENQKERGT